MLAGQWRLCTTLPITVTEIGAPAHQDGGSLGGEDQVQTPQDSALTPGLWTRGHRSGLRRPENTAIDDRSLRGVCLCVSR